MSTTIDRFKAALSTGGARANQFSVILPTDRGFASNKAVLLKAASLPAFDVGDVAVPFRGKTIHFAGEKVFAQWTATFINDNEFSNRKTFEEWHYDISNNDSIGGDLNGYWGNITVNQLDRNADTVLRSYVLHNAYPSSVSDIQLDYGNGDAIEEFTVTFTYDYFTFADGDKAQVLSTGPTV
jgi:hypothetical protein